jgi:hypothetical protein
MELNTRFTSMSTQNMTSDTSVDRGSPVNMLPPQAKVFQEADFARQFAFRPDDQSIRLRSPTAGHSQTANDQNSSDIHPQPSREKRGAALGACAKSEFRECRGGDALKEGSSSYVKFDQYDDKKTRGESGRGSCNGIVLEAMHRIDRSAGATDLPSAVTYMRSEINGRKRDAEQIHDRIMLFQENPESFATRHYELTGMRVWNAVGAATHEDRTNGLIDSMGTSPGMSAGDIAYVGFRVQHHASEIPTSGHVLLVQRLPPDAHANASSSLYAVFDPNNGVFTYPDWAHTEAALRRYADTAYNEDGYTAAPDQVRFYSPTPEHRPPPAPHPDHMDRRNQLEPRELGLRPPPFHDEL